MAIIECTDAKFDNEIKEGLVMVDFWAPWCGPCKMISPILDEVASEMGEKVKIIKMNVDDNPTKSAEFGVLSIPTILIFKDGESVDKILGFKPKEAILEILNKNL